MDGQVGAAGGHAAMTQIAGPFKRGRFCNYIETPIGYFSIVPHSPLPMTDDEVRRLRDVLVTAPEMRDWLKEWVGDVKDTRGNCEFCGAEATCRNCRAFDLLAKAEGEEDLICWNCGGTTLKPLLQSEIGDYECRDCRATGDLEDFDPRFNKTLREMRRRTESKT